MSIFEDQPFSCLDLLEALPDGTALLDDYGVMLFVSGLPCELTGNTRDELVGQRVQILIPKRLRRAQKIARRQYASDPSARLIWSDQDLTVLCRDGSELSVDFVLSPLVLNKKSWMVASIRDNRAGREAEQARLEADERFRLAFEDNMAPMVFTDLQESAQNDALLETIVALGEKMDLTMLAEGIETAAQLGRLRHPCGELEQGYLFSAAVPASQVTATLVSPLPAWANTLSSSRPVDATPTAELDSTLT